MRFRAPQRRAELEGAEPTAARGARRAGSVAEGAERLSDDAARLYDRAGDLPADPLGGARDRWPGRWRSGS